MSMQASVADRRAAYSIPADVLAGLTAPQKSIPSKYFYDAEGSRLFESICLLPEYYVARTETALLGQVAKDIAAFVPQDATLIEFGSGSSTKTRLLLEAAPQIRRYVPIDICRVVVERAARTLREHYPHLSVSPLVDDFTQPLRLPAAAARSPLIGFFPGSTIGNFEPDEAHRLLENLRAALVPGDALLLGVDMVKDRA